MKSKLTLIGALILSFSVSAFAQIKQEKRAQTGMHFLSVSVDPRGASMADALIATEENTSLAMFYNPSTMAFATNMHFAVNISQWFADIKYYQASASFPLGQGKWGVIGASIVNVDYGQLTQTIRADNERGYIITGSFEPQALALGIGYAKMLSDRFSVGGHIRYVYQNLGNSIMDTDMNDKSNTVSTPVFDFGVLYRTGFRSLNLAIVARNFSPAVTYEEVSFEAPLDVRVGVAMNFTDVINPALVGTHDLVMSIEGGHPRSYPEQIRVGLEYTFADIFSVRAGYVYPSDDQVFSVGAGINIPVHTFVIRANYAFTQFDVLQNVHRIGFEISF